MMSKNIKKRYGLEKYFFTSESVSWGHPDKLCDQVSDAILDAYLRINNQARIAIETFATPDHIIVGGEVSLVDALSKQEIDSIIRKVVQDIGYDHSGFNYKDVRIINLISEQSREIAASVVGEEEGAGDQGMMFGFACLETPEFMPAPIQYSHHLIRTIIAESQRLGLNFGPDGKTQLTIEYTQDKMPKRVENIVASIQHPKGLSHYEIEYIIKPIILKTLPPLWVDEHTKFFINPSGSFTIGGPVSDTGLTGRKIIVDTYGGVAPHGGGAFSGKDPSKVDRSGAYAARYVAKNVVAAGLAKRCLIQIAYAIGVAKPLSIYINTNNTAKVSEQKIIDAIVEVMDFTPRGIRNHLKLDRPIYQQTSFYGHFGRTPTADGGFSWENLDLVDELRAKVK